MQDAVPDDRAETIAAVGSAGTDGAVLASTFCVPPTGSASVNSATGIPGPSRITNTSRFTPRCSDGTPWQFPGGSNCP